MSNHQTSLFKTRGFHKQFRGAVLFVALLVLCVSHPACTHKPWDIDQYIQALERSERDEYQKPEEVIKTLELKPGMAIADIGSGSGYFTRRFAQAVGQEGKVLAVDVEAEMLEYNRAHIADLGPPSPTEFILAEPNAPLLPPKSVDLIFLCNVYHHIENHVAYFAKLQPALSDNGRIVIIDFYHDERSGKLGFSKHHLVPRERVIRELQEAGFSFLKEHTFLPKQYFLEFTAPS